MIYSVMGRNGCLKKAWRLSLYTPDIFIHKFQSFCKIGKQNILSLGKYLMSKWPTRRWVYLKLDFSSINDTDFQKLVYPMLSYSWTSIVRKLRFHRQSNHPWSRKSWWISSTLKVLSEILLICTLVDLHTCSINKWIQPNQ